MCTTSKALCSDTGRQKVHHGQEPPRPTSWSKSMVLVFQDFLSKVFGYEWCTEQPYLCRNEHSALILHVDDVLFVGKRKFGKNSSCQS